MDLTTDNYNLYLVYDAPKEGTQCSTETRIIQEICCLPRLEKLRSRLFLLSTCLDLDLLGSSALCRTNFTV